MTRFLVTAALTTALGLAALTASAADANFAGAWTLDKAKSQGLSSRLQTADKVTWTITQDDKTIAIGQKLEGGQGFGGPPGAGGPPAGAPAPAPAPAPAAAAAAAPAAAAGSGMGGAPPPPTPVIYNLDGSETSISFDRGRGTGTLKATREGNALQLSRKNVFNGPNGQSLSSETRKLELSGDGKVLTATIHSENARGTTHSTLIFNKQ